jgi:hypothetical protein
MRDNRVHIHKGRKGIVKALELLIGARHTKGVDEQA